MTTTLGPVHPPATHDGRNEDEHARLREALRERLVELRSLSQETKLFVGLTAAALAFLAFLALVRNDHLGPMVTNKYFSVDGNSAASMTQILFVTSIVVTSFGWAMVVTAASRSGWLVRLGALGALALWFVPDRDAVTQFNTTTNVVATALVGAEAALVVFTWFPERDGRDEMDPLILHTGQLWTRLRRLMPVLSLLLFLGLYLFVWHQWNAWGSGGDFPSFVGDQMSNIQWVLVPVIILAGADFGDWGNFGAARVVNRVRGWIPGRAFLVVTAVVAAAIAFDGLRISRGDGAGLWQELILGAVLAAVTAVVVLAARPSDGWPGHFPYLILFAATVFDGFSSWVISTQVSDTTNSDAWDALVWLGLAVVALAVIAARPGRLPAWVVISAAYVCLVGVTYTFTDLDSVSNVVHPFGWTYDNAPYIGFEGLKATAGLLTLATILVALLRRRLSEWGRPIVLMLNMTIAFQVLAWINSLYGQTIVHSGTAKVAGQLALFAAVVLVLALSWEFAASGEAITNGHRPRFPRDARVLAFLAYVVISAAVTVFWSSIGTLNHGRWDLLESQFEAESFVQSGLLFLGSPLVIASFVIGFNRWRRHRRAPDQAGAAS